MSRIKKLFNKKRPQLRRCAFCDKPGHNKSTCSIYLSSVSQTKIPTTTAAPIRFFVHHVAHEPLPSAHVVNLKKEKNIAWHQIPAIEPEKNNTQSFESAYQRIKKENQINSNEISKGIFANLSNPAENPKALILEKEKAPKINPEENQYLRKFIESGNNIKQFSLINELAGAWKDLTTYTKKFYQSTKIFLKENFVLRRLVAATIILMIILVAPGQANSYFQDIKLTKNQIAQDSTAGFLSLQNSTAALMQANLPLAQTAINDALDSFATAVDTMETKHQLLQKIASAIPILQSEVKSRQQLLLAGQKIAQGNTYLLKGISDSQAETAASLDIRLDIITSHLNAAIPNYKEALANLDEVDSDALPLNYQGPFKEFKTIFTAI